MRKLFGTDGIRGRANLYPMNVETILALGRAFGQWLRQSNKGKVRVVIGKDTRLSGYLYENALIAGLCSMGIDTLMVGPLPTPGVAFITRAYRADAGVVISASHNPYHDNGIKFFTADGYKFPDTIEMNIEELMEDAAFDKNLPSEERLGKNSKIDDADGRYIEFVKATLPRRFTFEGLRIALDCANGAAFRVAPLAFKELDAEVFCEGVKPNGININKHCGTLHLESLKKSVLERRADVGIALDGDADRVILVDENGNTVDGDMILAICAKDMLDRGELTNNCVVGTVMSNFGLIKCMEGLGIDFVQAKVGDRYVISKMIEHGANLGGEQSGHLIFSEQNTTGDGLVSAMQVLRIMKQRKRKLSTLTKIMDRYPQVLLNIKVSTKPKIKEIPGLTKSIEKIQQKLENKGRVLIRYSGTENVCRVMLEGPSISCCQRYAKSLADIIKDQIGI